jgi:hypothetical protein
MKKPSADLNQNGETLLTSGITGQDLVIRGQAWRPPWRCKDTDEVSDENVEAAGPMMKAGEVFDEEMGATEDTTENGEDKVEAAGSLSKAEEVIDKEIVTADHSDAVKMSGYLIIFLPVSLTVLFLTSQSDKCW